MQIVRAGATRLGGLAGGIIPGLLRVRALHGEAVGQLGRERIIDEAAIYNENHEMAERTVHQLLETTTACEKFRDLYPPKKGVQNEADGMIDSEEAAAQVLERNDLELAKDLNRQLGDHPAKLTAENKRHVWANLLARSSKFVAAKQLAFALSVEKGAINETEESKIAPKTKEEFEQLTEKHEKLRKREAHFNSLVKEITSANISPEEKCKRLENLLYHSNIGGNEHLHGLDRLNSHELKRIFFALWDNGGYDQMVEMMLVVKKAKFKESPLILEIFGRALIESSYFNPHIVHELGEHLNQKYGQIPEFYAIRALAERKVKMNCRLMLEALEMLRDGKYPKGGKEEFEKIMNMYQAHVENKTIQDDAIKGNYIEHLARATTNFQIAFNASLDPRYGYSALHSLLELGNFAEAQE